VKETAQVSLGTDNRHCRSKLAQNASLSF
jgi:hypothetical protein